MKNPSDAKCVMRNAIIHFLVCGIWILGIAATAFAAPMSDLGLEPFYMDIGARPQALGRTFIAIANDDDSTFYNPGGLPWSKGIMVYEKNSSNISAAQAYPTGFGSTLGISIVQSGVSNFTASTGQTVDFSSNILVLSAASKLSAIPLIELLPQSQNIGLGLNLKAILGQTLQVSNTYGRSASGWEMDAGLLYKALPWLNLGATGKNIMPASGNSIYGGVIKWDDGELEDVPATISGGFNAKIIGDAKSPIYMEGNELTISSDLHSKKSIPGWTSYGLEWGFRGFLFLRCGTYTTGTSFDATSFGVGLKFGGWGLDIANYADSLNKSKGITFSILYDPEEWTFEKRVEEKHYDKLSISNPISDLSPSEESVTYDDSILVSGKAKPGISVSVNGQTIAQDTDGKFVAQVPLNSGKNLILIDLMMDDQKETITRKVLKKPKIIIAEEKQIKEAIKKSESKEDKDKLTKDLAQVEQRKQKVEALVAMGVVDVSPQSEFALAAPVTRGELASWLVKAANIPLPKITTSVFQDVPANHPQAPFIKAAVDYGLLKGSGNMFYPDAPVSKSEAQEIFRKYGIIK